MTATYGADFDGPAALKSLASGEKLNLGSSSASVDSTGALTVSKLIATATLTPTSNTAGVTGQIAWDASFIYICAVGGTAGNATWLKASLASL